MKIRQTSAPPHAGLPLPSLRPGMRWDSKTKEFHPRPTNPKNEALLAELVRGSTSSELHNLSGKRVDGKAQNHRNENPEYISSAR